MNPNEPLAPPQAREEALTLRQLAEIELRWRLSAQEVGEHLSTAGPNDYYEFTSDQWRTWALDRVATLLSEKAAAERERDRLYTQRLEDEQLVIRAHERAEEAERARDEAQQERDQARKLMVIAGETLMASESSVSRLTSQLQEAQRKLITDPMLHDPDCAVFGPGHRPKCDCVRPQLAAAESQLTALRALSATLRDEGDSVFTGVDEGIVLRRCGERIAAALSSPLDPQTKDTP